MSKKLLVAGSVALVLLSACGKPAAPASVTVGGAAMVREKTIVENASNADNLKTLVAAVKTAKLDATLSQTGPFTVFAPTDEAFAALPAGTLQALLKPENSDLLTQLLTYHVVPGKLMKADLTNGMRLRTAEGHELAITVDDKGMVSVNGIALSITDVPASNGVVHVINAVLLPPVGEPMTSSSSSSAAAPAVSSSAMMMDHSSSAAVASTPAQSGQGAVIGVTMDKGVMYRLLDNGERTELRTDVMMANGIKVSSDGKVTSPDGRTAMMKDGQVLTIDGNLGEAKDGMPKAASSSSASAQAKAAVSGAEYGVYTEGVVGNGKTSVLFFHATWCPECKKSDAELAQIYGAGKATLSTYRVDYDTSGPLKQKYGVVTQHTFVVIDGTGKAIKTVIGPSEEALQALVQS
ncbi:MAG TPA: fasciclin domain-containing protein [Candidatus Peribacteria bacterium]|nr:fasciclin domain-containing protein [Candidatus Peribacteria bacterium]